MPFTWKRRLVSKVCGKKRKQQEEGEEERREKKMCLTRWVSQNKEGKVNGSASSKWSNCSPSNKESTQVHYWWPSINAENEMSDQRSRLPKTQQNREKREERRETVETHISLHIHHPVEYKVRHKGDKWSILHSPLPESLWKGWDWARVKNGK